MRKELEEQFPQQTESKTTTQTDNNNTRGIQTFDDLTTLNEIINDMLDRYPPMLHFLPLKAKCDFDIGPIKIKENDLV
ncbi:unnamed protein product, partial [marine sediment metagenome]